MASIEASSAANLGEVIIIIDGSLTGASYTSVESNNSVIELDTSATAISGGKRLLPLPLAGKNDRGIFPILDNKILLYPGQVLTVAGSSSNSATIRASVLWKELF